MQAGKLIETFNSQLIDAQVAYYAGAPILSDGEYDTLEAQLISLVNSNPNFANLATVLTRVGDSKNSLTRIKHDRPMLSIENYYTPESYIAAAKNYGDVVLEEPKRDGISCEISFKNGRLVRAVTRGDGEAGEDMTEQVHACKAIPQYFGGKNLPKNLPSDLRIRGELVMRKSELARINALGNKQYSNTRNLVAGTMKQQDMSIVASREILLMPWDMYSPDQDDLLPDSAIARMNLAYDLGFPKYEGIAAATSAKGAIEGALNKLLEFIKTTDVVCDGVVIKADSHGVRNVLGVSTKFTRYQNCFKPQNLSAETKLVDIEFGLGRTGKVTPVAILEPVDLGGAMTSRANLCNETYMENLGIMIGSTVKILRSGDVIPYITGVVNNKGARKLTFPTHCPSCNSILRIQNDSGIAQRFCDNSACPGKAAEQFVYIAHRDTLEIDNLGASMADELVDHRINNLADLFEYGNVTKNFTAVQFKRNLFRSGANTVKMIKSLEQAKTATWDRWIASLNIPMIGHSLGEDIAKALNLTSDDMGKLPMLLLTLPALNIEKLGPVKTASIVDWAKNKNNVNLCNRLHAARVRPTGLVTVSTAGKKLDGINFCITGSFERGSRPGITADLEKLGAVAHNSVTKNVNLLICGEAAGSKLDKAKKLGIKIVDSTWLTQVLGK